LNTEKSLGELNGYTTIYESDWHTTHKQVVTESKWQEPEPDSVNVDFAPRLNHRLRSRKTDKSTPFTHKKMHQNRQLQKKQRTEKINKEIKKSRTKFNTRSAKLSESGSNEPRSVPAETGTSITIPNVKKKDKVLQGALRGKFGTKAVGRPKGYYVSKESHRHDLHREGVNINRSDEQDCNMKARIRKQRKRKHRQALQKKMDRGNLESRKILLEQLSPRRLSSPKPAESNNNTQLTSLDDTIEIHTDNESVDVRNKRKACPKSKDTPKRQEKLWKVGKRSKFLVVVHQMNSSPVEKKVMLSDDLAERWKPIKSITFPSTPSSKLRVHCTEGIRELDMLWTDPGLI